MASDLVYDAFSVAQGTQNPTPPTIASAAAIAPTTRMTFVTGTTAIATITPPLAGHHELCLVFTNAAPAAFLTSGNVKRAIAPTQNVPVLLEYDPVTGLYW